MTIPSPWLPTYLSSMPLGSLQTRSTPRTSTSRSGIPSLDAWIPSSQSLKISPLLTSGSSSLPPTTTTTLVLRKARRRLVQPRVLPHPRCQYIVERRTPPYGLHGRNGTGKSTSTHAIDGGWAFPDISFRPTQREMMAEVVSALKTEANGRQPR